MKFGNRWTTFKRTENGITITVRRDTKASLLHDLVPFLAIVTWTITVYNFGSYGWEYALPPAIFMVLIVIFDYYAEPETHFETVNEND